MGWVQPTPIQAQAIPPILAGKDVIASAQTGSGKTAAFVLPTLQRLLKPAEKKGVRALIVSPTRELALQSTEQFEAMSRYVPVRGLAVFGGAPMPPQINALKQGVDALSATPGRLLDHVYEGRIDFGALEVLVLDEADRMMDMGFLPDIQRIISLLPPHRQNLIFSATIPPDIQKLAEEICHHPVRVRIGASTRTAAGIRHAVYPVGEEQKAELLLKLLKQSELSSVIVFTRTKIRADKLARALFQKGVEVAAIHGDRSQSERIRALEKFKEGRIQVLVATDVASRGIDVKDVSHVINYDVPHSPEDYIHRAGRTARAEAEGDAFTLMSPEEEELVRDIEKVIEQPLPRVTLPDFEYRKSSHQARGAHGRPRSAHGHGGDSHGGHRRPHRGPSHGHSSGRGSHRR